MRDKPSRPILSIRRAHTGDIPTLQALYREGGGVEYDWLDWSQSPFYWLIGDVDGIPQGIIMALPGCPFGQVDFLYLSPSLTQRTKARLARDLAYAGVEYCYRHGASAVMSTIRGHEQDWQRIAQKRGWTPIGTGTFFLKRT